MRRLFFHEESIHEVSRRYLEHEYVRTYGQAETNMPPHFFIVGGITIEPTKHLQTCGPTVLKSGQASLRFKTGLEVINTTSFMLNLTEHEIKFKSQPKDFLCFYHGS